MTRPSNQTLSRSATILLIACSALLLAFPVYAQSPVSPNTGTTIETLENRISETEAANDLDETNKGILLEHYRKAASYISQRQSYAKTLDEFTQARESAPEQARALRKELEKLESDITPHVLSEEMLLRPLSELEQQLLGEKANLSAMSDTAQRT